MQNIRLAIIDDHEAFRDGITNFIARRPGYIVVITASNGKEFIKSLERMPITSRPTVVITDVDMPEFDGFETVTWLKQHYSEIRVVVLSMNLTEMAIMRMLTLGVSAYLHKSMDTQILEALDHVVSFGSYFKNLFESQQVSDALHQSVLHQLSSVEKGVLLYLSTDMRRDEIALMSGLSTGELIKLEKRIYDLFQVRTRIELMIVTLSRTA